MKKKMYSTGLILGVLSIFWGIINGFVGFTLGTIGLIKCLFNIDKFKITSAFILNIIGLLVSIASIVLIIIFVIF